MLDLADRIRHFRTERGLTVRALAAKLEISHQAIVSWEVGRNAPPVRRLDALADALGVTVPDLLTADVPKPSKAKR